ncbi:hypothetical protein JCM18899A_38980 [Nocardioides sp. AN3]
MTTPRDLAAAIAGFRFDPDHEATLMAHARNALIDSIGVAVAGRRDAGYATVRSASRHECPRGTSRILDGDGSTSPGMAAFLNGYAMHALDYDDVSETMYGHPSTVILPSVLAVADWLDLSLGEVLRSYVVGYDTACAVAEALPIRPHYARGWHSTSTVGVIGAAAALAHLTDLDELATANALGIAATSAAGSRQNFGA